MAISTTMTLATLERIASPARNAFADLEYWLYTSASQDSMRLKSSRSGADARSSA